MSVSSTAAVAAAPASTAPHTTHTNTTSTAPARQPARPLSMARPGSASRSVLPQSRPTSRSGEDEEKTAVKVAVRVRPALANSDPGYDLIPHRFRGSACNVSNPTTLTVESPQGKKLFVFDRVFADSEPQDDVWGYVRESVTSFVQGYNVSILAYGQSGAGKSYTMGTSGPAEQSSHRSMGIIPRAAEALFEKLSGSGASPKTGLRLPKRYSTDTPTSPSFQKPEERNWQLKATYVEIYNEHLRDLLVSESIPQNERGAVVIREDTKGRIILTGLQQVSINSMEDLMSSLNFGSSIRQTDATAINSKSSRSHAVFSLNLIQKRSRISSTGEKRPLVSADGMTGDAPVTIDSKLHFVDLAGSERLKNSGLTGDRVKEGISINAGLASLGKVISQLSSRSAGSHVSYRDSKLTRLLQDSLGGNAYTYMIACVNPVEFHLSETLNTVQYAQRARAIQSRPQIQQRSDEGDKQVIIDRLRSEVAFLRDQIRLSQHTDRRNNGGQERSAQKQARENELQNQLLDIQENYSALSQRHAKLISELAKGKVDETDKMPVLKGMVGTASLDRLNRSSNFAEAVEQVVLEYEKTIQSLESSLSNTRSTLSTSESSLLEREGKVVYLEAVTQQMQARIHKAMDREANSENYLRELEAKLEGISSGEEKHLLIIQDLRKELERVRESESSAEEYISTLEERLAEAEQDTDLMQREINRLENIVERQRSIGKLDNLLSELDNIRHDEITTSNGHVQRDYEDTHSDAFHDRLVATASAFHPNDEMRSESAEEEWKGFGPMDGDDGDDGDYQPQEEQARAVENGHRAIQKTPVSKVNGEDKMPSPAQARALSDKLETMTMELFDLRVDHESALADLDDVSRKYQIALSTLAELQDAVDGARNPTPTTFLERGGVSQEDGQASSSSRMLPSASSSHGESPTLVENSDAGTNTSGDYGHVARVMQKEETLAESIRRLKRVNAEKDISINELTENYSQLQDQHKDTLNYIEELKEEMQKAQAQSSSPPGSMSRRNVLSSRSSRNRESRVFATLQNLTLEHLDSQPGARKSFETNINAALTESQLRDERIQALEAEIAANRKEMEVKNTMLAGLTRERSSQPSSSMDSTLVATMREHLSFSRQQLAELQQHHASHSEQFAKSLADFKESFNIPPVKDSAAVAESEEPTSASGGFGIGQGKGIDDSGVSTGPSMTKLQEDMSSWEANHQSLSSLMQALGDELARSIAGLDVSLRNSEQLHTERAAAGSLRADITGEPAEPQTERAKHIEQIQTLQKEIDNYKAAADAHAQKLGHLESSYSQILAEAEADAQSRKLSNSELQTHRDLVMSLEEQIDQQKSLATFHQQGLKSLQESHARELDELKMTLAAQQAEADNQLTEQLDKHQSTTSALQEELTKAHMEMASLMQSISVALDEDTDHGDLHNKIETLANERRRLSTKHEQAAKALLEAQKEMQNAKKITADLETKVLDLTALNEETLKQLETSVMKEQRSSRLVQELEDQLNNNFDEHNNRLSTAQKERADVEKELEEHRGKVASLEAQLNEMKRMTSSTFQSQRDSNAPSDTERPSHSQGLRKSTSQHSLPSSPPPAVPLPPLPGGPGVAASGASGARPDTANTTSRPGSGSARGGGAGGASATNSVDLSALQQAMATQQAAHTQQLEEQDGRLRTVEKHLYAEKQLTQTLEEALVDLETQANKTKHEADAWKKKCRELEEEATALRKERGNIRNSLQAVEEERDRRIRAEAARRQLEERMEQLGGVKAKGKKKNALNCF